MSDPLQHPDLWGFINSDAINGDEYNGAGHNLPIEPVQVDSFEALKPFIITDTMTLGFTGCADLVIAPQDNTVMIPCQADTISIRRAA